MNERSSTATGVGPADSSREADYLRRLQECRRQILAAKEVLQHRQTHETRLATIHLEEALYQVEAEKARKGFESRQGIHGEDPAQAEVEA